MTSKIKSKQVEPTPHGMSAQPSPQVVEGLAKAKNEPGHWFTCYGPAPRPINARIRANQANNRGRWRSITKDEPYTFKSWTDPETKDVYVIVCYGTPVDSQ